MAPSTPPFQPQPEGTPSSDTNLACPQADSPLRSPVLGKDCWILSGPTASGKTALAVDMAARMGAEIVSVDSMAVYRGLDIGTAKPSPAERSRITHHLLDLVEPGEIYTVARWLAAAADAVEDCRTRGKQVLFVGGTPLYLRALRDGLDPQPARDPEFRQRLEEEVQQAGPGPRHARLAQADPVAAARIHPHDARRIIRALEIVRVTGRPNPSSWFDNRPQDQDFASRMMVLDQPRRTLRERIDRRVEGMFAAGLIEETRAAAAGPGGIGATARQAAGYTEALEVLAGRMTPQQAIQLTQQRTYQLAKRQLTWLRSFSGAIWIAA